MAKRFRKALILQEKFAERDRNKKNLLLETATLNAQFIRMAMPLHQQSGQHRLLNN